MAFGGTYKKTGKFAPKQISKLASLGYSNQDDFLKKYNLNQQSATKDFGQAFQTDRAWGTPPRNIDRNFSFKNLPEVGSNAATQGLRDQAQLFKQQGQEAYDKGNQVSSQGEGALTNLLGTTLNEYGQRTGIESEARNRFLNQTEQAIDPRLSGQQQAFLDLGANTRRADIERFYGAPGSPGRNQLAKDLAYNVADLDQLGVGGTSEGALLASTLSSFNKNYADSLMRANELSRGEAVNERGRVASAYDTAAGRNLQDAQSQQQGRANLLGLGRGIGGDLTSAGAQRQQLAATLGKLGLDATASGLDNDMKQRQLEAELQQGEKAFQTDLTQQQIDNERIRRDRRRANAINSQLQKKYL